MRIEGPNSTTEIKSASKTKKKEGAGGIFSALLGGVDEVDESSSVTASSPIGSLDVLLAVQEDGSRGDREANERALIQGGDLLDSLEDIKSGILMGSLSKETLQNVTEAIAKRREQDIDPELSKILDEIDLRAQVELAKLSR